MNSHQDSRYNAPNEDGNVSDTNSDFTSYVVLDESSRSTPNTFQQPFDPYAQRQPLIASQDQLPINTVHQAFIPHPASPPFGQQYNPQQGNMPFIPIHIQQQNEQPVMLPMAPINTTQHSSAPNSAAPVKTQEEIINQSILIIGLSEQFGSEEEKIAADEVEVQQILRAINSTASVKKPLRYGELKLDGTPRNVIVNLNSENDRDYVLQNSGKLKDIPKWSNVTITILPPPRQSQVDQNEIANRTFVIFGLDEQFGSEEDKITADKCEVKQMLYSISCTAEIKNMHRSEMNETDTDPRSITVELDSKEGRDFVLQNAERIKSVPKWKNVNIKEISVQKEVEESFITSDNTNSETATLRQEIADLKQMVQMVLQLKDKGVEKTIAAPTQSPQPSSSTHNPVSSGYRDNVQRTVEQSSSAFPQNNSQQHPFPMAAEENLNPYRHQGGIPANMPHIQNYQQSQAHTQQVPQHNLQNAQIENNFSKIPSPHNFNCGPQGEMPSKTNTQNYQQPSSLSQQIPQYNLQEPQPEKLPSQTSTTHNFIHGSQGSPSMSQQQQYYQREANPQYSAGHIATEYVGKQHHQSNMIPNNSWHYNPHQSTFPPSAGHPYSQPYAQPNNFPPHDDPRQNEQQYNPNLQTQHMPMKQPSPNIQNNPFPGIAGNPLHPQPNANYESRFASYKQQQENNKLSSNSFKQQQKQQQPQEEPQKSAKNVKQPPKKIQEKKSGSELHNAYVERATGPPKTINILVLGQTGVGKSTWINGIANYMAFGTLNEAMAHGKPVCLIPSQFTFYDTPDEPVVISLERSEMFEDDDENEVLETGQSSTQEPRTYQFKTSKYIINIIDTPGIGDVRGIAQDKENTRKILNAIAPYKDLHAICFLFKNDETRLNDNFQFCISELLLQLHRDAIKNITFFFTHTAPLYEFGETFTTLEEFIKKIKKERGVEIPINEDNMFCIDNEALNLVSANAQGIEFVEQTHKRYANSWEKAAQETHRFIQLASSKRPHVVGETLSINKSRTMIYYLAEPLAKVNEMIASNIEQVNAYKIVLQNTANDFAELEKSLKYKHIGIEIKKLDYPKTVCTDPSCTEVVQLTNTEQFQTLYKTICHRHCHLKNVDVEKCPDPNLQGCSAMGGTQNCRICEHSWESHMHIRYEQFKTTMEIEDKNTKEQMKKTGDVKAAKENAIKTCEAKIAEFKAEQDEIIKISLRFGGFLQANAIIPYNDAFEKYVEKTIAEEERFVREGADRSKLENLQALLSQYKQSKIMMDEAAKKSNSLKKNNITNKELQDLKNQLFKLKHSGETLRALFEATAEGIDNNNARKTIKFSYKKESS